MPVEPVLDSDRGTGIQAWIPSGVYPVGKRGGNDKL
jgi:hypothetical protein